jgi:hypothetical protein
MKIMKSLFSVPDAELSIPAKIMDFLTIPAWSGPIWILGSMVFVSQWQSPFLYSLAMFPIPSLLMLLIRFYYILARKGGKDVRDKKYVYRALIGVLIHYVSFYLFFGGLSLLLSDR